MKTAQTPADKERIQKDIKAAEIKLKLKESKSSQLGAEREALMLNPAQVKWMGMGPETRDKDQFRGEAQATPEAKKARLEMLSNLSKTVVTEMQAQYRNDFVEKVLKKQFGTTDREDYAMTGRKAGAGKPQKDHSYMEKLYQDVNRDKFDAVKANAQRLGQEAGRIAVTGADPRLARQEGDTGMGFFSAGTDTNKSYSGSRTGRTTVIGEKEDKAVQAALKDMPDITEKVAKRQAEEELKLFGTKGAKAPKAIAEAIEPKFITALKAQAKEQNVVNLMNTLDDIGVKVSARNAGNMIDDMTEGKMPGFIKDRLKKVVKKGEIDPLTGKAYTDSRGEDVTLSDSLKERGLLGTGAKANDLLVQFDKNNRVKFSQRLNNKDQVAMATMPGGAVSQAGGGGGGGGGNVLHLYNDAAGNHRLLTKMMAPKGTA